MTRPVWEIDQQDPMRICIWASCQDFESNKPPVFTIFLGEAMESAGREAVMNHIAEIERSPWIRPWHADHTFKLLNR